jgi:hypothetical protein
MNDDALTLIKQRQQEWANEQTPRITFDKNGYCHDLNNNLVCAE